MLQQEVTLHSEAAQAPLYHDTPDAFIQKYGQEFSQVPPYMRQRVAYLIDQKVERQVRDQMYEFKTEVWAELKD